LTLIFSDEDIKLVLLDIVLPDVSGYEIMEKIRDLKTERNLKVCFSLRKKDKRGRAAAIKTGGDDYIVKLFSPTPSCTKSISCLAGKL